MTAHVPALAIGHDQALLPNQPFFSWLRAQTTLFISQIAAVLGFVYFLSSLIYYATGAEEHFFLPRDGIIVCVDYFHVLFIGIFILVLIHVLDDNSRGAYRVSLVFARVFGAELTEWEHKSLSETSEAQLKRFKIYFLCFWSAMWLLYIAFSFQNSLQLLNKGLLSGQTAEIFSFLVFALNNASLLFLFWCFVLLYLPGYRGLKRAGTQSPESLEAARKKLHRRLLTYSSVIIVLLTASFPILTIIASPPNVAHFSALFDALSGVLSAMVFALLIARLDSKLIGLPSWLICMLYLYSAVQPLFVIFEQQSPFFDRMKTAVLIVVFISKIYFFLIILYTLQTGRLLNYFFCFPQLSKRADEHEFSGTVRRSSSWKQRMFSWMSDTRTSQASFLIGMTAFAWFLLSLLGYAAQGAMGDFRFNPSNVQIDVANLVFITLAIFILVLVWNTDSQNSEGGCRIFTEASGGTALARNRLEDLQKTSERQEQKFKIYFLGFWGAMLVLYVIFFLDHGGPMKGPPDTFPEAMRELLGYPFLAFIFSAVNLLFVFCCFFVMYLPAHDEPSKKKQKRMIRYSIFVATVLIAAFPLLSFCIDINGYSAEKFTGYETVFQGLLGTLSAIGLALLIARLDSKLIGLSSWLIVILFAYSAIQPLSVVFYQEPEAFKTITTSVLLAALGFKVSFFLTVAYALQSGRMLNYFVCFPFLSKSVDSIFENQFEIRTSREGTDVFAISIWKKGLSVFSGNYAAGSRRECDWTVKNLRAQMKTEGSYRHREECGTHWVEITDSAGQVICESAPLRSRVEADELIKESVDKIPYCKYNRL
jgi:hypothetical protein